MPIVDMHIHSVHSDGLYTAVQIVNKAVEKGLAGIALTDHDSFDGVAEAYRRIQEIKPDLHFIAGCEFSTYYPEAGELHVLGYFSSRSYLGMEGLLETFQRGRVDRAYQMIEKLNEHGYRLDPDTLIKSERSPVGRMQIARELVNKGYFSDTDRAFESVLRTGAPCFVPKKEFNTIDIFKVIRDYGGKSVLAHPSILYKRKNWEYLKTLIESGLDGIEYKHPKISVELSRDIEKEMDGRLILTGGSDFHGDPEKDDFGKFGIDFEKVLYSFPPFSDK